MGSEANFLPSMPTAATFDVQKRIRELRGYLDSKSSDFQREEQHVNIRAAIKLYQDGEIDGLHRVCMVEGKQVSEQEMLEGSGWAWTEGPSYQFFEGFAYGHGGLHPPFHELRMLVRLMPQRGGDGKKRGMMFINDTGSSIMTLFEHDMSYLGKRRGYRGWLGPTWVGDANGGLSCYRQILVQIQLVSLDFTPWSPWINEVAAVKPALPGMARLTGAGLRHHMYIATAPGNRHVVVSRAQAVMNELLLYA